MVPAGNRNWQLIILIEMILSVLHPSSKMADEKHIDNPKQRAELSLT